MWIAWSLCALAGCAFFPTGPTTCEEAACDRDTELCRAFGSDTITEADSAVCEPLPAACLPDVTCECLLEQDVDGDIARCTEGETGFVIFIPGG